MYIKSMYYAYSMNVIHGKLRITIEIKKIKDLKIGIGIEKKATKQG